MNLNLKKNIRCFLKQIQASVASSQCDSPLKINDKGLPNWQSLLADSEIWHDALEKAKNGPRVLIPTSVGGLSAATILEGMLGVSLTLRGANVRFLLCDGVLPACLHVHAGKLKGVEVINEYHLKKEVCPGCQSRGDNVYRSTGLPIQYFSDFLHSNEIESIRCDAERIELSAVQKYQKNNVAIGEHALAGALRFYAVGNLPDTDEARRLLRRYLESALITELVMSRMQAEHGFEVAVFHHGIYVPQGIIGEVARRERVRVVNWQVAYRKQCFIFSHKETYHRTLIDEPSSAWENIPFNNEIDKTIMSYLKSRWDGSNDWIWFHDQPENEIATIARLIGLNFSKPTVSLLTNVYWDAQLHFKANAFTDMLEWILQSIDYFSRRPDLQLVIRIHPAEVRGAIPSRQPIVEEIQKVYPKLPKNIFLVPPESNVSTYALCHASDTVIIFGTKTGVEISAMGIPVVVAGEAWIRNKGITMDATSPQSYFEILAGLPLKKRLPKDLVERAKKYAFHFFYRRFLPLKFMHPCDAKVPYRIGIDGLEELLPGGDGGLDVICDGILKQSEFIYPAENYLDCQQ